MWFIRMQIYIELYSRGTTSWKLKIDSRKGREDVAMRTHVEGVNCERQDAVNQEVSVINKHLASKSVNNKETSTDHITSPSIGRFYNCNNLFFLIPGIF